MKSTKYSIPIVINIGWNTVVNMDRMAKEMNTTWAGVIEKLIKPIRKPYTCKTNKVKT